MLDMSSQNSLWRLTLFFPSVVALVLFSISPVTAEELIPLWLVINVLCSFVAACQAATPSDSRAMQFLKICTLGVMFCVLNFGVSLFGGCCTANSFHK